MTKMIDTEQLTDLLGFAHQLADAAARATLPLFRNLESVENKLSDGFDPVTAADRNAETAIRALIENHYPSHAITGEEFDNKAGDAFEWVIDPIDGTRAFMSGIPTWGTLIGLNFEGQPILGLMDQPFTQERFFAVQGQGANLRHIDSQTPMATRACASLDNAVLATTSPDLFADTPGEAAWQRISSQAKLVRYGGDCYNYALVAMGQVDIVMEQGLKDVDIQPLIQIVEEAGGIVTDWQGGPAQSGGTAIACGDTALHEKLLALLAQ
jgi:histidinol phosphatase-like enzyme (inositol monophosphatase family)